MNIFFPMTFVSGAIVGLFVMFYEPTLPGRDGCGGGPAPTKCRLQYESAQWLHRLLCLALSPRPHDLPSQNDRVMKSARC